jgi:hypothetical protein
MRDAAGQLRAVQEHRERALERAAALDDGVHDGVVLGGHLVLAGDGSQSSLPQGEGHTPVILGEAGDEALLGVVTLEILGFVLNPFNRTLQPARLLLA